MLNSLSVRTSAVQVLAVLATQRRCFGFAATDNIIPLSPATFAISLSPATVFSGKKKLRNSPTQQPKPAVPSRSEPPVCCEEVANRDCYYPSEITHASINSAMPSLMSSSPVVSSFLRRKAVSGYQPGLTQRTSQPAQKSSKISNVYGDPTFIDSAICNALNATKKAQTERRKTLGRSLASQRAIVAAAQTRRAAMDTAAREPSIARSIARPTTKQMVCKAAQ